MGLEIVSTGLMAPSARKDNFRFNVKAFEKLLSEVMSGAGSEINACICGLRWQLPTCLKHEQLQLLR